MSFLLGLKSKLYWVGAGLLAVLAFFVRFQMVKNQRDRAIVKADTLKAQAHSQRIKREIKKEEDQKLSLKKALIKEEIEKKEEGEGFEGIDNLTDSNKF